MEFVDTQSYKMSKEAQKIQSEVCHTTMRWYNKTRIALISVHTPAKAQQPPYNVTGRIRSEIQRILPWPMIHLSTKFHENRASSFCVILLINTNQLTNKRTGWKHNLPGGGNTQHSAEWQSSVFSVLRKQPSPLTWMDGTQYGICMDVLSVLGWAFVQHIYWVAVTLSHAANNPEMKPSVKNKWLLLSPPAANSM